MAEVKDKKREPSGAAQKSAGGGGGRWLLILAAIGFLAGWWVIYKPLRPDSTLLPPTAGITNRVPEALTNTFTNIAAQAVRMTQYVRMPDMATNLFNVPQPASTNRTATTNAPPLIPITRSTNTPAVRVATTNAVAAVTPVTNAPPPAADMRHPENPFEIQLALDRMGISSGSLDGVIGSQSRAAIRAFQRREGIPQTGEVDAATRARLWLRPPAYTHFTVTGGDISRLTEVSSTWVGKSRQSRLDHSSILEMAAERGHAHPEYIRALNPGRDWTNITEGTTLVIPYVPQPAFKTKAARVRISLGSRTLQAFDQNGRLMVHFPVSIAQFVEKRPVGELQVEKVAENPNYRFDPRIFPESAEARKLTQPLMIPPGPNNPVGLAWIGLSRPGYGIHGTPSPEAVGRTESHGCFRLANWNAQLLLKLVWAGMPVIVEP